MKNIIDVSSQVKEMLNRNNVQVMSLATIDKDLLHAYVNGRRKAVLIYRSKIFERIIQPLDDTIIEIIDEELGAYIKPGEKVMVVLPSNDVKRYVFQCRVRQVHIDRFKVSIMDPRFNVRHQALSPCRLKIFKLPELATLKLQEGALHLLRHMGGKEEEFLVEKDKEESCSEFGEMLNDQPAKGKLIDLSQGGMGMEVGETDYRVSENQLIYTDFSLSEKTDEFESNDTMNIKVFGIVRACRKKEKSTFLHIMFLNPLESDLERYFAPEKDE